METLGVMALIFGGITRPPPRRQRNDNIVERGDGATHVNDEKADALSAFRTSGGVLLLLVFIVQVCAIVSAASGNSLTKPTDINCALISPMIFLILKWAGVVGVQA